MRLRNIFASMLVAFSLFATSCDDKDIKTLKELKDEQKETIDRLISDNNIIVVDLTNKEQKLPDPIDNNVYYKFKNGLYLKVINKGDEMAERSKTNSYLYLNGYVSHKENKKYSIFNSLSSGEYMPIKFQYISQFTSYGDIHYQLKTQVPSGVNLDDLMCEGLAYPLTVLGNNAKVSLIIPFELGPDFTYKTGSTLFVEEALYQFEK